MKYLLSLLFIINALLIPSASAQNSFSGSIKGKVLTKDGKPAAYVSVVLLQTNKGCTSNDDGEYNLADVKPGNYVLRVSMIGLASKDVKVSISSKEQLQHNITLEENALELNELVVGGSFNKPTNLGKSEITPLDLPQSMGIISSKIIEDQQATRLGDVVKNVSGVSLTQSRGGVAETFSARGYSIGVAGSGGSIFKNGVISNTQGFPDASTLESVEVLKGSSALLYGNVSGGVLINMVTKKPLFNWGGKVSMLAGSYNQYKPTIDVYGPLAKNLAFRVVGTYEKAESFRDVVNTKRFYVNPSLLYKLGKNTDVLLQVDYLKSDIMPDAGVGVPNSRITITEMPDAPRNRYIYPTWGYNNTDQKAGFLTINHRFNEAWKLTAIGSIQHTKVDAFGVGVPSSIQANGDWSRNLSGTISGEKNGTAQLNLNGNFETGSVKHQLLAGADFVRISTESNALKYISANGVVGNAYDKINIYDPATYYLRTDMPSKIDTARTTTPQNRYGIYVQDLISLTSKFKVLAGLRWSYQTAFRSTIYNIEKDQERRGASADKSDDAFSPKLALIYQPIRSASIYASYTNNFTINSGTDIYGDNLKPSIVNQYELGAKKEFLDGKLISNFSIYRIQNSNFSQTALFDKDGNPNTNSNLKELSGETTSDGLEFDINANLSKNFYFLAGYGYNYMRYTNTTGLIGSQVEGERLINNPKHTGNGSIFYTLDRGVAKGLKLGLSGFYTGQRNGGNSNVVGLNGGLNNTTDKLSSYNALIPLKGFTTFDVSAGYGIKSVSLLVKVSNLFNTMNYIVHDRYSLNPIPPRMVAATLSYRF